MQVRYYDDVYNPKLNSSSADTTDLNSPLFQYAGGYAPSTDCEKFLNNVDPPSNTEPCSLTSNPFNLEHASKDYFILQTGISTTTGDFSTYNFDDTIRTQSANITSADQVITYLFPTLIRTILSYSISMQPTKARTMNE